MTMSSFKYYSTQRPVSIGTYPKGGVLEITNFDFREYVEEIGRKAWGFLTYDRKLSEQEMNDYELVEAQ